MVAGHVHSNILHFVTRHLHHVSHSLQGTPTEVEKARVMAAVRATVREPARVRAPTVANMFGDNRPLNRPAHYHGRLRSPQQLLAQTRFGRNRVSANTSHGSCAHCTGHLYRYIPLPTVFLVACNRIREEDFAPLVHIGRKICHFLPHGWYGFLLNR